MVMAKLLISAGVASALNTTNTPTCSANGVAGGEVVTLSDGKNQRCIAVITPSSAKSPMPVLFWFHGAGGNAGHCGSNSKLVAQAEQHGFAYICGEAVGGEWDIPAKITDETGTPCDSSDSSEVGYMQAVMKHLDQSGKYDTKRVFTSGCSMGSAFSGYMGNCLKQWDPTQISAFATHSTGLKKKGDGNKLPSNWGECDGCQWWPFAPVKYSDSKGLKACIFDNTGDGDFYKTSTYLSQKWPQLGNPSESHFASGGHCQNIPYADIVTCLDISGSSPTPTPTPTPSPQPTPTPSPTPTPTPSPSPVPGGEPSVECLKCWQSACSASQTDCNQCLSTNKDSCVAICKPSLFGQKMMDWFCDAQTNMVV